MKFELHTKETAPELSLPLFDKSIAAFGMVPNLHAVMAESPALLDAYQQVHTLFQQTDLNADELTVVWQTINVEHECHYCVPAHAAVASMMKVDASLTKALRERTAMPTEKLQALYDTTLALVRNRGKLTDAEQSTFYEAGYENKHMLAIVLGISQKVMSNYVNHLADTPIDAPFKAFV